MLHPTHLLKIKFMKTLFIFMMQLARMPRKLQKEGRKDICLTILCAGLFVIFNWSWVANTGEVREIHRVTINMGGEGKIQQQHHQ